MSEQPKEESRWEQLKYKKPPPFPFKCLKCGARRPLACQCQPGPTLKKKDKKNVEEHK